MILVYDHINMHTYLACGLLENFQANEEQTKYLEAVDFLVSNLRQDISNFYEKLGVATTSELIERAENDPRVDKQIKDWMCKVFTPQSNDIISVVKEFNVKYAKNYERLMAQNKGEGK